MKGWTVLVGLGVAVLAGCGGDTDVQLGSGGSTSSSGAGGAGGQGGSATTGGTGGAGGQGGSATTGPGGAGGQGGSSGGVGTIACGIETCDAATQQCCSSMQGQTCIDLGGACQGLTLGCLSAANCTTGDVCCLTFGGAGSAPTAACATECMGGGGPGSATQLCADSTECPMGQTCQQGMIPGDFMVCSP